MLRTDIERYPDKPNWCSNVMNLLCNLGFYDAWLFQSVGNTELF